MTTATLLSTDRPHNEPPRRRLPHWGVCLALGLALIAALFGWRVVWPAYRVQTVIDSIDARPDVPTYSSILGVERPRWLQWLAPDRPRFVPGFDRPKYLRLDGCPITDQELRTLECLAGIEDLSLSADGLSDEALRRLGRFQALKSFSFGATRALPPDSLDALRDAPKLEDITMWGAGTTDGLAVSLRRFPRLTSIAFQNTPITGTGLSALADLPSLEMLSVGNSPLNDEGLKEISAITSLRRLYVYDTQVTAVGLTALKSLPRLQEVDVQDADHWWNPLPHLSESANLVIFEFQLRGWDAEPFTDREAALLARHTALRAVDLSHSQVTDATVRMLAALPNLEYLNLAATDISDESLELLAGAKSLKRLGLKDRVLSDGPFPKGLTREALNKFFQARPDVKEGFPSVITLDCLEEADATGAEL